MKKGFTLIEVMICIVIVMIIGMITLQFSRSIRKETEQKVEVIIKSKPTKNVDDSLYAQPDKY